MPLPPPLLHGVKVSVLSLFHSINIGKYSELLVGVVLAGLSMELILHLLPSENSWCSDSSSRVLSLGSLTAEHHPNLIATRPKELVRNGQVTIGPHTPHLFQLGPVEKELQLYCAATKQSAFPPLFLGGCGAHSRADLCSHSEAMK